MVPAASFAESMVGLPKVVFSKTVDSVPGRNVRVENGDLVEKVNELKNRPGKDLLVYGGAGFVSSLIANGLIDEFNLFVHPTAIGDGMSIFSRDTPLTLRDSKAYESGIVVDVYEPRG
jgi:dihydrofolate reductase